MATREESTVNKGVKIVRPQVGMQEKFTRSNVDCCLAGGVLNPQPLTSHILTPNGFVSFSDIKVGDEIVGLSNEKQTVTHYEIEGEKDCIRIVLEDGSTAESALDHRWWILKDGHDMTAISFELLESFQIAQEKNIEYEVAVFKYNNGNPVPVKVKEVQDIGKKEVACISVSNEDELYVTDDYLLTKNCGKAQPYNARILTPNGYTYMGKLKEGDEISSALGGTQKVLRIYEKGMREIWKVEFEYGSVECCPEHLWTVIDKSTKQCITMSIREIKDLGYFRFGVPCPAPIYFTPSDEPLPIEPYLLGRMLGKGYINNPELSDNMRAKLNLIGITDKMFIPEQYKFANIRERKDLLRGYIDEKSEDGIEHYKFPRIMVEKTFEEDLAELVLGLGGSIHESGFETENIKALYVIMPKKEEFYSSLANKTFIADEMPVYRDIISISYSREALTRCILVSDKCHLYITNDYVCTHNTYAAILMVAEPTLDPKFRACYTRRNLANLKAGGGILDDFKDAYGEDYIRVTASENPKITFPSGAFVDCIHIANEEPDALMERAKGWQYDCFYLDELTSYQYSTFRIVGTRCRGKAKWTGKIRSTTNPKRSHWVRKILDYYIGIDGFLIPERDGIVRYYYQMGNNIEGLVMGDTPEEVYQICKIDIDKKLKKLGGKDWDYRNIIRSFTFYAGKMAENTASIKNNPTYIASVAAVGGARSQQLIEGNWNVDEEEDGAIPISSGAAQSVFLNDECRNGDYWITADLADVGTDNLVALYWDGFHICDKMILTDSTPRQNYERIKLFATKHNVAESHIIYDGTHGTYMYDYMPDAKPFISASSPIGLYALMSDRLKDECYLRLVDMINKGRLSIDKDVALSLYRHHNIKEEHTVQAEFLEECAVVRFRETQRGKKKLLTKKEMNALLGKERSMDLLDPCAMRMMPVLELQYGDELTGTRVNENRLLQEDVEPFDIWNDSNWC